MGACLYLMGDLIGALRWWRALIHFSFLCCVFSNAYSTDKVNVRVRSDRELTHLPLVFHPLLSTSDSAELQGFLAQKLDKRRLFGAVQRLQFAAQK